MPESPSQRLIDELYRNLKGEGKNGRCEAGHANAGGSKLTDRAVLEKMFAEKERGEEFRNTYHGEYKKHRPNWSNSEAVASVLRKAAFYSGNDPVQMERLIRGSALSCPKFDDSRGGSTWLRDEITTAIAATPETYQSRKNLSSPDDSLRDSDDDYTSDEVPGLVCFAHRPAPDPVGYLLEKAVPLGYVTNLHGAGGFGKSVLAMLIALSVSSYQKECLGLAIRKCGNVLYLDSELDERGQHPRVREICKGLGIPVPERLHYLSALGLDTATAFERTHHACKKLGIALLVIDSWGPFMQGDMESARDVIRFYNDHLKPLVDLGVTILIVDHQSRTQEGQNYQKKGAFGSVYKENLARSVLQIERVEEDREAGALRVRVRHRKSNFGPRFEPFDVTITFGDGKITTKAEAVQEAEKASEETLNSRDRVRAAVKNGPLTVKDLAESTGLSAGTVRNRLSELVPGTLHTAELDGRTKVYGYPDTIENLSSLSPPPKGNDNDDRFAKQPTPASFGAKPGETTTLYKLNARKLLADQPSWLRAQIEHARSLGFPENQLKALASAVAAEACGDATKGPEVLPTVEAFLTHGLGCDCEECA